MDERKDEGAKPTRESAAKPESKSESTETRIEMASPPLAPGMEPMGAPAGTATAAVSEPVSVPGLSTPVPATGLATGLAGGLERAAKRILPIAAATAAVAVGIVIGGVATHYYFDAAAEAPSLSAAEVASLKGRIAKLETELGVLKTSAEGTAKMTSGQLAKLGDRVDRTERAQAEPAGKLAKLTEAVERLEKRAAADVTGSITPPAVEPKAPPPPIIAGWSVRDVYAGVAVVQSRYGLIEVERGDSLPGLGRVDSISKQDGRWVISTSKGLIVSR